MNLQTIFFLNPEIFPLKNEVEEKINSLQKIFENKNIDGVNFHTVSFFGGNLLMIESPVESASQVEEVCSKNFQGKIYSLTKSYFQSGLQDFLRESNQTWLQTLKAKGQQLLQIVDASPKPFFRRAI